jgi:hypothetical protein
MRLGTSKYSTVGEEDTPSVCRRVGHWQNLETDTTVAFGVAAGIRAAAEIDLGLKYKNRP